MTVCLLGALRAGVAFFLFEVFAMTTHINPMSAFPYDINSRMGTYFDRNKQEIDKAVLKNHYCVAYEGTNIALGTWARKQSKGLTNIATFFAGATVEEKRSIIWRKCQTQTLERHLSRFFDNFRDEDLYLWYLSSHDLPVAEFIDRFLAWYREQ